MALAMCGLLWNYMDSTICTHTINNFTGAGLNRNCTGNPLTLVDLKI